MVIEKQVLHHCFTKAKEHYKQGDKDKARSGFFNNLLGTLETALTMGASGGGTAGKGGSFGGGGGF